LYMYVIELRRRSPRHDQRRRKRHGELCVIAGEPFKGMVEKGEIRTIVYKSMIKFPPFPPTCLLCDY
jgi:hypothetical protein